MANTIEDVERIVAAVRQHPDRIVMCGHVLRVDEYFCMVRKWVQMGMFGEIFYVECDYIHDLRYQLLMEEWKVKDEIPMVGGGCHPLDLLRWYVGDIEEVSAMANHIAYKEMCEDTSIIATYKFKSGVVGKVTTLYGSIGPRPEAFNLSIYGTKGTLVRGKASFDGMGEKEWLEIPARIVNPEADGHKQGWALESDHFLDSIIKNEQPISTALDAANATIGALYAVKAEKENKTLKVPTYR